MGLRNKIHTIEELEKKLAIKKAVLVDQSLSGSNPSDILKAQQVLQNIENKQQVERKSYIIDPLQFTNNFGYKDKSFSLSYEMLRRMSMSSIIAAIHTTRINQVASFCEPQQNKYSTGFVIRKKHSWGSEAKKPTKKEEAKIDVMTEFIMNCGSGNVWDGDDFDSFMRKWIRDSMWYDQGVFDVTYDKKGMPFTFGALDSSTFRIADSYVDEDYRGAPKQKIKGYLPSYVQIHQNIVRAEYYPWELCFGVRNPTTNIYNVGYGFSEQEILINQITSMLWSEEYNRKFFSQGSMPKGFIRAEQAINPTKLQEFRQGWNSMMAGVANAHKTPILEAGKIEWVDLQKNNRDMEFSNWFEFLIKVSCSIYAIDPAEINFPLSGGAEQKAMFEGSNEARIKHSKDKGLYPLLKFGSSRLNKFVVSQIDPDYELAFVGMDSPTETEELEMDVKKVSNFETLNEVRERRGLKKIEGGDVVLNSMYMQTKQMEMQQQQMQQGMAGMSGGDEEDYPFEGDDSYPENGWADEELDPDEMEGEDENPFVKAFNSFLENVNHDDY